MKEVTRYHALLAGHSKPQYRVGRAPHEGSLKLLDSFCVDKRRSYRTRGVSGRWLTVVQQRGVLSRLLPKPREPKWRTGCVAEWPGQNTWVVATEEV